MTFSLSKMSAPPKLLFYIIFAVSGFSGLIYESIWSHYLKLYLGHAAYAQTLVLIIFMGGMAIGAWLCSRLSRNWYNVLLGYAFVEAIIGLLALSFHGVSNYQFQVVIGVTADFAAIHIAGHDLPVNGVRRVTPAPS
jgi:predicted membrane-bound spermidine synthase